MVTEDEALKKYCPAAMGSGETYGTPCQGGVRAVYCANNGREAMTAIQMRHMREWCRLTRTSERTFSDQCDGSIRHGDSVGFSMLTVKDGNDADEFYSGLRSRTMHDLFLKHHFGSIR